MEYLDNRKNENLLQQMRRQTEIKPKKEDSADTDAVHTGTFGIRLALAGVLLLTVILMDQRGKSIAGLSMHQIMSYVTQVDYRTMIETWVTNVVNDWQAL